MTTFLILSYIAGGIATGRIVVRHMLNETRALGLAVDTEDRMLAATTGFFVALSWPFFAVPLAGGFVLGAWKRDDA